MIIAVSGNMGSGKTTLANKLVELYDFEYIPHNKHNSFLNDFFDNEESRKKYFLPTQLSFLISKAVEIKQFDKQRKNIVIDRSLLEDIKVFAAYWIENDKLEDRIKNIYCSTADYIVENTPKPDAYFVSNCPPDICEDRISQRKKADYEKKYPKNHIKNIAEKYKNISFYKDTFIVEFDGTKLNYNDSSMMKKCFDHIFNEIERWNKSERFYQLSLFDEEKEEKLSMFQTDFREFISIKYPNNIKTTNLTIPKKRQPQFIYLAAPFSSKATEQYVPSDLQTSIHIKTLDYGMIPEKHQKILTNIAKKLKKTTGCDVLLPHKDINKWGKKRCSEEYLMHEIKDEISKAAAIVAIPDNSLGVHLELGYALCRNIPIVVFSIKGKTNEFWIKALAANKNVRVIEVSKIKDISGKHKLLNNDLIRFIRNETGETI